MRVFHYILMVFVYLQWLCFLPHYWVFKSHQDWFVEDFRRWKKLYEVEDISDCRAFFRLMVNCLPFRNVFYFRMGFDSRLLRWYTMGLQGLHIMMNRNSIGGGMVVWHGDATIIKAKSIGKNFEVWQNVTIGVSKQFDDSTRPVIGDNVKICTGAIVCGDITIGNNVIIGAGSVVFKSIPDNCVVVGNPARIIKQL